MPACDCSVAPPQPAALATSAATAISQVCVRVCIAKQTGECGNVVASFVDRRQRSEFALMPSLLMISERMAPLAGRKRGWLDRFIKLTERGVEFGAPFARCAENAPRTAALVGCVLALAATGLTLAWIARNPIDYDLSHLRSDPETRREAIRLTGIAREVTGFAGYDSMAILAEHRSQVSELTAKLIARRNAAPADAKPFRAVHTLQAMVPENQPAKLRVLLDIADFVRRARKLGALSDAEFAKIEPYLPPADLQPFDIDDLPADIARPFTEEDGSRGGIVYLSPTNPELVQDAKYLFRWADSYRHGELSDGSAVRGSGRAVIAADIWLTLAEDVPWAVLASLINRHPRRSGVRISQPLRDCDGDDLPCCRRGVDVGVARCVRCEAQLLQLHRAPHHLWDRRRLRGQCDAALLRRRDRRRAGGGSRDWRSGRALQHDHHPRLPRARTVEQLLGEKPRRGSGAR